MSTRKVDALFSGDPPPPPPDPERTQLLLILSFGFAFLGVLFFATPFALFCALWAYYRCTHMLAAGELSMERGRVKHLYLLSKWAIGVSLLSLLAHGWLLQQPFYQSWIDRLLERVFL